MGCVPKASVSSRPSRQDGPGSRRHDLECIVARQHWRDDPLAVFRITGSTAVDSGRVEFTVTVASVDEERDVLRAVAGRGVHYGAFRYART